MTGFAGRKEPIDLDDLSPTLRHLCLKEPSERTKRGISERASQASVFEQSPEVQAFHANDPITVSQSGGQLVQEIFAQAGDTIMQARDLPARFLPIL
jgi:hypothetical protein